MRVLSAEAMAGVDRRAIEELGIPGLVLMENAALGVVEGLSRSFPEARRVAVFCGPGNNGGDGFAVARHLVVRGFEVELFSVPGSRPAAGDAGTQLEICRRMGLEVREVTSEGDVPSALEGAESCDLLVDALFGTGLGRPLAGHFARLVEGLSGLGVPCLAVDLPSGLDAGSPRPIGPHLEAALTVTFAAPKVAHVLPPACHAAGELVVADLGIPPRLVEEAEGDLTLLLAEDLRGLIAPRPAGAHKGTLGHLLLIAGSPGKSGAAVLAARAAVRAGAGLVTAAVPRPLLDLVDGGCLEAMTLPLAAAARGGLAGPAVEEALEAAAGKSAVALGPGLGEADETRAAIRRLALEMPLPLVLDADGLNAFAGGLEELRKRPAATVLTPHPGELGRLLGWPTERVVDERLAAVRQAARASGAVVILKGFRTLVAVPEELGGGVGINTTGNPGMATGGSGDVLTGILGALLAQGLEAAEGARLGTYLHGAAGDLAAARCGQEALAAGDLVNLLGEAYRRLSGDGAGEASP